MTLVVTHATVATDPNVPLLDHTDWNADHALTGVLDASQAGTGTANIGKFLRGDMVWSDTLGSSATNFKMTLQSNQNTILELASSTTSCSININQTSGTTYQFYSSNNAFGVYNSTLGFTPFAISGAAASGNMRVVSGFVLGFSSSASNATAGIDTGMSRVSAGVFAFGNGATGNTTAEMRAGNFKAMQAGNGFFVKEGSNAKMGQATLVGGTVTVNTTAVNANSRIFLSAATAGGTQGHLSYTQVNGTSFTINSDSVLDTSVINWLIMEAA